MASLKALRIRALILASGFVLTASSIISVSCGDSRVNYFPSQIGQSWDMIADGTGDITHFEIVNPPTSDRTDLVNIRITKTQARAYWQNNSAGAELWWGMHQLGDRRWVADYSIANFTPPNLMRFDYLHFDANSYMVIPPAGAPAGDYFGYSQDTWCVGDNYCSVPWVKVMWLARISYPTVSTPFYKGPALLNEEFECAQPIALSEITNPLKCAHELWYFAPNIGLVQITPEWVSLPCDPNCPPGTQIPPFPPAIRRIS
jgi:hypothetical protein